MIAASHISNANPQNEHVKTTELEHLAVATAGLRRNLALTLDPGKLEAVFAVCILLFKQVWASVQDRTEIGHEGLPLIHEDSLVHLGAGFKTYVMGSSAAVGLQHSKIFGKIMAYSPRVELMKLIECSELPQGSRLPQVFENEFRDEYFRIWPEKLERNALHCVPYMVECRRLTIALSALDLGNRGFNIRPLDGAIVRYLFTWPMLVSSEFVELMKQGAKCVLLLFWHFYTIVQASATGRYWWARRRTDFMLELLGSRLREEDIKPRSLLTPSG